jgi:general secretion pathway protein L
MRPKDILNADMATLGGWLKSGWHWWLEELHAMIPEKWRTALASQSRIIARRGADGGYQFFKNGRTLESLPVRQYQPVTLALPENHGLMRTLSMPLLSRKDLRSIIALDMDRLTPYHTEDVLFDFRLLERDAHIRKQPLRLAIVPKATAMAAVEHAQASGLIPKSLTLSGETPGDILPFDFMRYGMGSGTATSALSARQFWWAVASIMLMSNIGFAIIRDINETSSLRERVTLQTQAAKTAQMLQRRVITEHQRRLAVLKKASDTDVLFIINSLSQQLPAGAWVQRLSLKDGSIRLTGYASDGIDVLAALRRSPVLTNVQATSSEIPTQISAGQPFDVTATVRQAGQS